MTLEELAEQSVRLAAKISPGLAGEKKGELVEKIFRDLLERSQITIGVKP
jgi:hypothetical protein